MFLGCKRIGAGKLPPRLVCRDNIAQVVQQGDGCRQSIEDGGLFFCFQIPLLRDRHMKTVAIMTLYCVAYASCYALKPPEISPSVWMNSKASTASITGVDTCVFIRVHQSAKRLCGVRRQTGCPTLFLRASVPRRIKQSFRNNIEAEIIRQSLAVRQLHPGAAFAADRE